MVYHRAHIHDTKITSEDLNAKIGQDEIFWLTILKMEDSRFSQQWFWGKLVTLCGPLKVNQRF
jgi:hypothetical protein